MGFIPARSEGRFIPFEWRGALSSWFQRKLDVVINVTFILLLNDTFVDELEMLGRCSLRKLTAQSSSPVQMGSSPRAQCLGDVGLSSALRP